ncbi:Btz domain [Macleaya cordata]|uniref:Btz domain n=1 Tax=Macleaya cordata TaxID=56857 RepID=A0A200PMX2_MACCD|nr:Btz domain [Macleaya cordata]
MSGREGRESETKRSSSRLEREPSSKRSRRDGKPATERTSSSNHNLDSVDHADQDQKHRRRLQDALPLEAPLEPESKVGPDAANRELNKSIDGTVDGNKRSSDPSDVPRSRTYFQHDERDSAGQGGSVGRRAPSDHGLGSNPKDRSIDRNAGDRTAVHNLPQRGDRTQARGDEKVWRHDGFFELESDAPTPARKRPAFREKKEPESGNAAGITETTESGRPSRHERPAFGNSRREERGDRPRDLDRPERPFIRDRALPHRGETHRLGFPPRDRFGGGSGGSSGRDRFNGRHGERNEYHRPNSNRAEKWTHDLFDEANRSPTPKNEEDQIAKVEALLAL